MKTFSDHSSERLKIKVCGMRDADNIRDVAALDIDLMGFIFWPKSSRYVGMIPSHAGFLPDYSRERLESYVRPDKVDAPEHQVKRVGVFVDEMPQTIVSRVYNYRLDFIQLHGSETPTLIENLRRTLVPDIAPGVKFIKAFGISSEQDLEQCKAYEGIADLFLFDTRTPSKGGSGRQFDWTVLQAYQGRTPFLLSGGIGPDDVDAIRAFHHPQLYGIDVNSRFETAPALKDVGKLKTFVEALRA